MKVLHTGILLSLLATVGHGQTIFRDGDAFTGLVRSARIERATFSKQGDELVEGPRVLLQQATYTADGRMRKTTIYLADGSLHRNTTEIFAADGKQLSSTIYDGSSVLIQRTEYAYDEKRWRISETRYGPDGQIAERKFFQPQVVDNQLVSTATFNQTGRVLDSAVNSRDTQDNSVWEGYRSDGTRQSDVYSRFVHGRKHDEHFEFKADGSLASKIVSDVFDGGASFEHAAYDGAGKLIWKSARTLERDDHNNLRKTVTFKWNAESGEWEPIVADYYSITYYQ